MKRIFVFVLLVMAFSILDAAAQTGGSPAKPLAATGSGDLNGDGALTPADQSLLCDHLLGKVTLSTAQQSQADLNGDGKINVADLVGLLNLSQTLTLNLPGTPPVPLTMAICPAGVFMMGRTSGELESDADESPRHKVTLTHSFGLGVVEVTKRQWQAVMGTAPWSGQSGVLNDLNSPAVCMSWNDIAGPGGFIEKLNQHLVSTGQRTGVRLPTEAEWEYACRAGTTTRFFWGDDLTYAQLSLYACWEGNGELIHQSYAHLVGLTLPNIWGLYDMAGNVWEWCQDWDGTYPSGAVTDPTGPRTGTTRVLRGGSWVSPGKNCRSASRISRPPDSGTNAEGFRLALTY